jgi:ATP-binding cassette, subfamily B, multidrug efflux pump
MRALKELKPLLKYIRQNKFPLVGSIVYILLTNLTALLAPWILKLAIDSIENFNKSPNGKITLIKFSLFLVGVAAAEGIFKFYMRKILVGVSRKIEYSIRSDFFSHLQALDSSFFSNNRTGSIMALITNDLDAVRNFIGPGLLNLFNTIFIFISTLIVMFLINVKLSLYSLIAIPILPVLVSRLSSMLYQRFKKSQEQYAVLSARTQESIAGIKVVKSFTQEANEINTFADLNLEYIKKNMSLAKVRSIFWPAMIFIGGIGTAVVLFVGGRQVISGVLTLGQFVQFSAYIGSITWPLISLGWVINLVQQGSVSTGRINKILTREPKIAEPKTSLKIKRFKGNLKFNHVWFKYINETGYEVYTKQRSSTKNGWIVKDINFEIPSGIQVGVVGFTGSGKSTIANLIPRLYDPQKGHISIDGFDIRNIPLGVLRQSIGYVMQEPFIFSKSIKENILFGKETLLSNLTGSELDQKIMEAAIISHLHEDIEIFPDRYETLIGERGVTLSGGQKQRLAIARAILIKPSILILDDSFSSVDTNTEELILRDLREHISVGSRTTCILISHRISTIKNSDLIMVLDEGKIKDTGNHKELMKKSSIYQKLYYRQQLSEELAEEI